MAKKKEDIVVEADDTGDAVLVDPSDAPNIAYVGKEGWKPLKDIHTAERSVVRLPEDQSEPFYHEKASFIINTFPHLYKRVKGKGDK